VEQKEGHIVHPLIKEFAIKARDYQIDIARTAQIRSTLVVLPTGLGKTIIALFLMAERLMDPRSSVLMMAPTKPLVEQHRSFLSEMLPGLTICMLTGEVPPERRKEEYMTNRIVVTTPQVVKNDLISGEFDISSFSTLVVDEAHRAVGDYPYPFIAGAFYGKHPDGLLLGLTASPGHDPSRIHEVCRNLGIENIEVRVDSDPDVRPYVQDMDVTTVKVEVSQGMRTVIQMLERMFLERISKLQRMGVLRKGSVTSVKELIGAAHRIQEMIVKAPKEGGAYYQAMSVQAQAMKVAHALELAETQGTEALYQYMDRLLKESSAPSCSKATRSVVSDQAFGMVLNKVGALRGEPHPKLEAVVRFIRQQLREDPASRIIAFTHYRDTATMVLSKLKPFEGMGIRAVRFVGQATRDDDTGLSQKEQKAVLDRFREGDANVLIATSVAEEGLDIPGADLVIFYEPVPSEIRTIQRRGRTGRHSAGKVIVLVSKETRDIAYSFSARDKEARMERQLLSLRRMLSRMPLPTRERKSPSPLLDQRNPTTLDSFSLPEPAPIAQGGLEITVDHREMSSTVVEELIRSGVKIRPAQLDIGDYLLSDRVIVERKTVQDLSDSLIDGRLFEQLSRAREGFERPLMIVEGDDLFNRRNIARSALMGALASITVDFNVPVIMTRDPTETAGLLQAILRRSGPTKGPRRGRGRSKGGSMMDQQLGVLSSLPGISNVTAKKLLFRFGSLRRVLAASEEELLQIDGIGKVKARELSSLLDSDIGPTDEAQIDGPSEKSTVEKL
jgi:Fanconi anemia group M protein